MSDSTSSSPRPPNETPHLVESREPVDDIDALTQRMEGLAVDPFRSIDATDTSLRFTNITPGGDVRIYLNSAPRSMLHKWTITAYKDARTRTAEFKGMAVMIRKRGQPLVCAKSGWARSLDQDKDGDMFAPIKGSRYTPEALALCGKLNVLLQPGWRDRGDPGKFLASHSGMQLLTWLVNTDHPYISERGSARRNRSIESSLGDVLIIMNRKPEPSCLQLAARIQQRTGRNIRIEYRGPDI